jgi:hypothetical protein
MHAATLLLQVGDTGAIYFKRLSALGPKAGNRNLLAATAARLFSTVQTDVSAILGW